MCVGGGIIKDVLRGDESTLIRCFHSNSLFVVFNLNDYHFICIKIIILVDNLDEIYAFVQIGRCAV